MTLLLAIVAEVFAIIAACYASKAMDKDYENVEFIRCQLSSLFFAILSCGIAQTFDKSFTFFALLIVILTFVSLRICKYKMEIGICIVLVIGIFILLGNYRFSIVGDEVISNRTETEEVPLIFMNGGYVFGEENRSGYARYTFYIQDENKNIKVRTLSDNQCELELKDGEAKLKKIIHYETKKNKYFGFESEHEHVDYILYIPEADKN